MIVSFGDVTGAVCRLSRFRSFRAQSAVRFSMRWLAESFAAFGALPFCRVGLQQSQCGPAAGVHGNKLVFAVGEAAFVVRLKRFAATANMPGSVFELIAQQEFDSALIHVVVDRNPRCLM